MVEEKGHWCEECDESRPESATYCSHCGNRLAYVIHTEDFERQKVWLVRVANRGDLSFYLVLEELEGEASVDIPLEIVRDKLRLVEDGDGRGKLIANLKGKFSQDMHPENGSEKANERK